MENPLFEQACRRAVSLEAGGVEHQGAIKSRLICNLLKIFLITPILLHLTKRLYRGLCGPYSSGASFPLKSVLDDVDDAAETRLSSTRGAP